MYRHFNVTKLSCWGHRCENLEESAYNNNNNNEKVENDYAKEQHQNFDEWILVTNTSFTPSNATTIIDALVKKSSMKDEYNNSVQTRLESIQALVTSYQSLVLVQAFDNNNVENANQVDTKQAEQTLKQAHEKILVALQQACHDREYEVRDLASKGLVQLIVTIRRVLKMAISRLKQLEQGHVNYSNVLNAILLVQQFLAAVKAQVSILIELSTSNERWDVQRNACEAMKNFTSTVLHVSCNEDLHDPRKDCQVQSTNDNLVVIEDIVKNLLKMATSDSNKVEFVVKCAAQVSLYSYYTCVDTMINLVGIKDPLFNLLTRQLASSSSTLESACKVLQFMGAPTLRLMGPTNGDISMCLSLLLKHCRDSSRETRELATQTIITGRYYTLYYTSIVQYCMGIYK